MVGYKSKDLGHGWGKSELLLWYNQYMINNKIRVSINGFGRIGRLFFKMAQNNEKIEIVAVNDLGDLENMAYLLNYDTAQDSYPSIFGFKVGWKRDEKGGEFLFLDDGVGETLIPFFSKKDPSTLPWSELEVDVVAECTGVFNSFEKSNAHLEAGAKRVVLSGPTKDTQNAGFSNGKTGATILMGINEQMAETCSITSNGSCTTNASAVPLQILSESVGVESAFLNTVHSYTSTQSIVDGPSKKDFRRGRSAAQNIVPTSTGAAVATGKVIPELAGNFDGISVRVPTVSGSLADITFISKEKTTVEEVNNIFKKAEKEDRYMGILRTESNPIVSSDIVGDTHACIVDLNFTKVSGRLVKIVVWYDNESGFTNTFLEQIVLMGKNI